MYTSLGDINVQIELSVLSWGQDIQPELWKLRWDNGKKHGSSFDLSLLYLCFEKD